MRKKLLFLLWLAVSALHAQTVAPDQTGMALSAQEWAKEVVMGWNLGNSLESSGGETGWGNPATTKEMIHAVKEAGFNAIRIPVRWTEHLTNNQTMTVDNAWLARVKQVVDWALEEDMYVIINIHHEAWLDRAPFYKNQDENNKKLAALWTSIATYFRDYGQRLAFAGTNETIAIVNGQEQWGSPTAEYQAVQNSYNQTFINAVRETGGKNYYRNLIVQTYACNAYYGLTGFVIPTDKVEGRMSVEFHCYDPYEYAGGGTYYYWGDKYKALGKKVPSSNEKTMTDLFDRIRNTWGKKGLGVILGEYGVTCHYTNDDKTTQLENEQYFIKCMVSAARERGFAAFVWDNNVFGNGTEKFGIFNRRNGMKVGNEYVLKGICEGAGTQYKEPDTPGGGGVQGGEVFWEGNAMLDWGNGLQLYIPQDAFEPYGRDVWLALYYTLDYTDYNMIQFFYGDWDQEHNVEFSIDGVTYTKEFQPGNHYSVGSGEDCVSLISFSDNVLDFIFKKGLVLQGHGLRLTKVVLGNNTGIHTPIRNVDNDHRFFLLDGRQTDVIRKGQIYIHNGKKVLVE